MQISLVLLALASTALGLPNPKPVAEAAPEALTEQPALDKRTVGGIYITTDIHWGGTTGYKVQPLNTCIPLDSPWYHTISSFGPDPGTRCNLYWNKICSVQNGWSQITYPGSDDLTKPIGGQVWNDRIGSFLCEEYWG